MLRMMCKKCAKADIEYYHNRTKTGNVSKREIESGRLKITIKCTACGNEWHYKKRRK